MLITFLFLLFDYFLYLLGKMKTYKYLPSANVNSAHFIIRRLIQNLSLDLFIVGH